MKGSLCRCHSFGKNEVKWKLSVKPETTSFRRCIEEAFVTLGEDGVLRNVPKA